jgi:diguanylate cyclase (GGDEF)-like protein
MSDSLLDELRVRFRETSRIRLEEMTQLLGQLDRNPSDTLALQKLAKHFHGLAGMGATYGFPRVSTLGDEGESVILPLVKRGNAANAQQLAQWRALVADIDGEIRRDAVATKMPAVGYDVLLIEPEAELANVITKALADAGMRVRTCALEEATAQLDARLPDALILDADSYSILEILRGRPGGDRVGAIVTGGGADFVEKVRAIRCGADAFVAKPLDLAALLRRVGALRERKEHPARRILAVEDDAVTAALLRGILGSAGYEIEICRDPSAFEKTLVAFQPDLLLMDVQLSEDVSGHDLVRYVRQSERFSTVPIIIVTSDSERRAILEGTSAGADMLVTKPVDWDLLLSQIAARLERATVVRELTDRDALTGVLTRGAFETRARQVAGAHPAVLVLLDLDHFKDINDTHGHVAGDRVLAALGTLLRRRVRSGDAVARYGGEEFALMLEDTTVAEAVHLCETLLADFAALAHGPVHDVTFSGGVAELRESFDEAFRAADAALYDAKREGRARIVPA